jgi:rhamnosyltransferase
VSCERPCDDNFPPSFKGVELFYCPLRPPNFFLARIVYEFLYDIYSLFKAARSADIVYMLGYSAAMFFFIPKLFRKQLWVNPDGMEWKRPKFNPAIRGLLKVSEKLAVFWADRMVVDSNEIKKYLDSKYGIESKFIPYGALDVQPIAWDDDKFTGDLRGKITLNPHYWLMVARLEPENNIHTIIRGYLQSSIDMPLVVVGNFASPVYEAYVKRILDEGPDKKVIFTGGIYNRELLNMLRCNCFAYLHGHSVGGTNPSLVEIMKMKTVIIAHNNEFNREVCRDSALYFNDAEDLAGKMEMVDADREDFFDLRDKARERILNDYSWEGIVDDYETLIRSV